MKNFVLVLVWHDGTEITATKPSADRSKLEKARDIINGKFDDNTGHLVLREI